MRALAVTVLFVACAGRAAETDQYSAWLHPPTDSTRRLDLAINEAIARGVAQANRRDVDTCPAAASLIEAQLAPTALYYFIGPVRGWHVTVEPNDVEEQWRLSSTGLYRYAGLAPLARFVPLDPTIRVGDVLFGTDKLAHFFTNGFRYFERYRTAREQGRSADAAELEALRVGVAEENGWLGLTPSGVFSYADLAANEAGLGFYRALCEGGGLTRASGRWTMSPAFSIARFVDPCWDESYNPSAFAPDAADGIVRALMETCPLWKSPTTAARWRSYAMKRCSGRTPAERARWIAQGIAPDPARFDIARICAQ